MSSSPKVRTLKELRLMMQEKIDLISKTFESPEDDWMMVFIMQSPERFEVIPLENELFQSGHSKDILGEALRVAVTVHSVYRYALLTNGHALSDLSEEDKDRVQRGEVRIEQLPDAVEMLTLTVGDAESEEMWGAEIIRTPELLRTLKPWRKYDEVEGRFVGLNEYMQLDLG